MTNPNRDEISMDDRMPAEVELRSMGLSFTLGAGKNLSRTWERELRTESESRFRASVSRDSLDVSFNPPLLIDALWPAMNMQLGGVKRVFSTGATTVSLGSIHGVTEGLVDFSADAKKEIAALITSGVQNTAMAQLGYNPMQDPRIIATLELVTDHFRRQPSKGKSEIEYSDFGRVQIDITVAMKTDFRHVENHAGMLIRQGTTIDVTISGRGNMAALIATRTNAERAAATDVESVTIRSEGLAVILDDKPIAYLDQMRIARGGAVTLEKMRLDGVVGEAEGMESLVRMIASTMGWAERGASMQAGSTIATHSGDAQATIVPKIVRDQIEKTLNDGVKKVLRTYRNAVPEMDLEAIMLA